MRKRAKVDQTQHEIVQALRDCGCLVKSLAPLGQGVPDLMVLTPARLRRPGEATDDLFVQPGVHLVECKTGTGKLRPEQREFIEAGWPVTVIRSAQEARAWVEGD